MSSNFVHLHLHTSYSLLDGACRPDEVMDAVVNDDMSAVAITDHGAMYGIVDFYQKARKRGIRPILGCEVYVARGSRLDRKAEDGRKTTSDHLVLLAENDLGYHNLIKLATAAHLEGFYYKPRIDKDLLRTHHKGLIGLSACWKGELAARLLADDAKGALKAAGEYSDILGDDCFFLEIQDHGTAQEKKINAGILELSRETGLGMVATNDVHYLRKEHAEAHDVLLAMQTQTVMSDPKRMRLPVPEFYFKTSAEMKSLFRDLPQAIQATVDIASRCDAEIKFGELHFPSFHVPDKQSPKAFLVELCRNGLRERYKVEDIDRPKDDRERGIVERFKHELTVIEKTGFINYYLVVWDFVHFAREKGIPVGLRGSGGASLVAYVIGIMDIDPLRYSLIFERFLNPERVSPPDFDIDFCQRRRGEVIEYVRNKYGKENVAQIITFGSLGAKLVIRDVGRVLEVPYGECDRLAKMVPDDPKITLKIALEKSAELKREYSTNATCRKILDHAFVLEGLYRNPGTHAAGIVMAEKPLVELLPLTRDKDNEIETQYSMEPLGEIGLLKLDILGLRTLSVIQETIDLVRETQGIEINIGSIPDNDKPTYDLFNRGDTIGVFQLESGGMRELIRRVGIDRIEDLIAMIALYRPGPMNMLDDYVNRKTGKTRIKLDHPLLQPVLEETYGVMVYQEQVQKAASVLAGYTLGQGDILRRAMSKKDAAIMERQRTLFTEGCKKNNGIPPKVAGKIFDNLARFAGYGFNKSHSTAYAVVAYRTAYLKANYPAEFMAALLSSEMGDTERLQVFIDEAKKMNLEILPPHINDSGIRFRPEGRAAIRFGLTGIKNVGETAAEVLVAERKAHGPYAGLMDFCSRLDTQLVNRRVVESLVKCGCFDSPQVHRARLYNGIDFALSRSAATQRDRHAGQANLFETFDSGPLLDENELPQCEPWHENELLAGEKELLGFYISGHPLSRYASLLERYGISNVHRLSELPDRAPCRLGGAISRIDRKLTKKGKNMAVMQLEGLNGSVEVLVFPDAYARYAERLVQDAAVLVCGRVSKEDPVKLHASEIRPLEEAPMYLAQRLSIHVATAHLDETEIDKVREILRRHSGPVPVVICLQFPQGEKVFVGTDSSFRVIPDEKLIHELEQVLGEESVYVATKPALTIDSARHV